MIELTEETIQGMRYALKVGRWSTSVMIRRHDMGTDQDRTSLLISWNEPAKVAGGDSRHETAVPWAEDGGHISLVDYRQGAEPQHCYASIRHEYLEVIAKVAKPGDRMYVTVEESDRYGLTEVDLRRPGKRGDRSVYRGIVNVSGSNQHAPFDGVTTADSR